MFTAGVEVQQGEEFVLLGYGIDFILRSITRMAIPIIQSVST